MWRIDGLLSTYPDVARQRDCYRQSLHESFAVGHQVALSDDAVADNLSRLRVVEMKVVPAVYAEDADNTELIGVNRWVSVTKADCHRLSCEAGIIYLQMAFEHLPEDVDWWRAYYPLVYCLRRLRNVVVHCKPLAISQGDFMAKSTEPQRDGTPLKFSFIGTWFLKVDILDFEQTRGPAFPELFAWFQEQCDKHPAWWIIQCAVEQVCEYFGASGGTRGDLGAPGARDD